MKDYWLVIDYERMTVEICFCEEMMYNINACLATINGWQQEEMLQRLLEVKVDTPPFKLAYEYFTMEVDPYNIMCEFHMFDEPIQFFLYTRVFKEALAEYLEEIKKLFQHKK